MYWWWQYGNTEQGTEVVKAPLPHEINKAPNNSLKDFLFSKLSAQEILETEDIITAILSQHNYGSYSFKAAVTFAPLFTDNQKINEQLIIIAFDHPDVYVRCFWQQELKTGHNILIITSHNETKQASSFSLRDDSECL